jgi:hypothetical protein
MREHMTIDDNQKICLQYKTGSKVKLVDVKNEFNNTAII